MGMTVALPNDKISKQGKFTVSEVFHWKESKEMLHLFCNLFVVTEHGMVIAMGHACFRWHASERMDSCVNSRQALRHWADTLSGHRWVFTGKPRRSASHTPWCWGWFCQLAIVVPHWQWQFSPSRAIWEFSCCSVSKNKQTKKNKQPQRQKAWESSHGKCYQDPVIISQKQEFLYLQWFPKVFSCPGLFCHSLGTPCHCPLLRRACFPARERHVETPIKPVPESSTVTVP